MFGRSWQCAEPSCPFMVVEAPTSYSYAHVDTHGAAVDHDAEPYMEPCETCNGSGMVAVGPWGARPQRKRCAECRGGIRIKQVTT